MYVNMNLIRIHLYLIKTHKKYIEFYVVLVNHIKFCILLHKIIKIMKISPGLN